MYPELMQWITSKIQISVGEVTKANQYKWSSAGDLFSPTSSLVLNKKAIESNLIRIFNSATDCIRERGKKMKRDIFLMNSGNLMNILRCK